MLPNATVATTRSGRCPQSTVTAAVLQLSIRYRSYYNSRHTGRAEPDVATNALAHPTAAH